MSGAPSLSDVLDGRAEAVVTQEAKSKQVRFSCFIFTFVIFIWFILIIYNLFIRRTCRERTLNIIIGFWGTIKHMNYGFATKQNIHNSLFWFSGYPALPQDSAFFTENKIAGKKIVRKTWGNFSNCCWIE